MESLQAAQAAYEGGAQDIAISPGGCLRYKRQMPPNGPGFQTLTFAGQTVLDWQHLRPIATIPYWLSIGRRDDDLDGFFESVTEVRSRVAVLDAER